MFDILEVSFSLKMNSRQKYFEIPKLKEQFKLQSTANMNFQSLRQVNHEKCNIVTNLMTEIPRH